MDEHAYQSLFIFSGFLNRSEQFRVGKQRIETEPDNPELKQNCFQNLGCIMGILPMQTA
jgi:hypothetical protein